MHSISLLSRAHRLAIALALVTASLVTLRAAAPTWDGTPVVEPILPADVQLPVSQANFNNLAWQQFIALNWTADPHHPGQPNLAVPPSKFGAQGDTSPTVWESFKESSEVFRPDGRAPAPWDAKRMLPTKFPATAHALSATSPLGVKGLFALSKFDGAHVQRIVGLDGIHQADGHWLVSQSGYLALYEKRLNEDEFNYIVQNKLYDATIQETFAQTTGINLPDGTSAFATCGTIGAIEIKAAWIQLDDPKLWPLFKISKAWVSYPAGAKGSGSPKLVTVGLVGLHIIHKTANAQQFVWTTFEHVNNAPSVADIRQQTLKAWYTFYNPKVTTPPNVPPPSTPTPDYTTPVQVVRSIPISSSTANNIAALNQSVWSTIAAANPQSVFLNYELVNVLWPTNNSPTGGPGAQVPLTAGNPNPPITQQPVANTTLETYKQQLTCLTCHVGATTALPDNSSLASDYSFLFDDAGSPAGRNPSPAPAPKH